PILRKTAHKTVGGFWIGCRKYFAVFYPGNLNLFYKLFWGDTDLKDWKSFNPENLRSPMCNFSA
ncbi:MAG: hypothetical protein RPT13_04085, partial [SAR324 cluster bacterium]